MILIGTDAGKTEQRRQLSGKALETMVAACLDTQGTCPVILLRGAIIKGFVGRLQPYLKTLRILGRWYFQCGQGRHVVKGQLPGFAAVEVLLRAEMSVEQG